MINACPTQDESKKFFVWLAKGTNLAAPDGREDNTHLNIFGGRTVAGLAVDEIARTIPNLAPFIKNYDIVVAKDGSGDFMTVQEAIDAVPDMRKERTTIYIRNGIYKEKVVIPGSKTMLTMIGEDPEKTVITFDNYANRKNRFGQNMGTSGSSSVYVYANDFTAENLTFENTAGNVGQAVALFSEGDRMIFRNCRFLGNQDTLYTHGGNSRQYYENCYIEGTVDFIFGWSTVVFNNCEIHAKRTGGYLTAASTDQKSPHGYVFMNCKLTADPGIENVYLGRPWRDYAQTVYIDCDMGEHINPAGWHNWGSADKEKTAYYAEYGSKGAGARTSERAAWSHQLTPKQAAGYTVENILGGPDKWNPQQSDFKPKDK